MSSPAGVPETPEEWQWAIDMGRALTLLQAAKDYGLVTGGPDGIRLEAIERLTKQAAAMGIAPHDDDYCINLYLSDSNIPPRIATAHAANQRGRYGS